MQLDKQIQNAFGKWQSMQDLKRISSEEQRHAVLREENPDLMDLWIQYNTLLHLIQNGPTDDYL